MPSGTVRHYRVLRAPPARIYRAFLDPTAMVKWLPPYGFTGSVPNERIRYTDRFDDPNLPGTMQTTITLRQVSCGTELQIVQEGVPEVIPLEVCYLGWQESLAQLAHLVEPEIPG
jgi:uncharacterized protein YndB with AHSA1/START domain